MFFRMNIRQIKGSVWMLNILAILCISFLFIMIYKEKKKGKFLPDDPKIYYKKLEEGEKIERKDARSGNIDINDYDSIWKAPISGIEKKAETKPNLDVVDTVEDVPLAGIVHVNVIMKSAEPSESRVRLFYPEMATEEEKPFKLNIWSKEGDELKPPYDVHPYFGKIKRIEDDRVIFTFRGEDVTLSPEFIVPKDPAGEDAEVTSPSPTSGIPEEVLSLYPEPPEETVEYKPDHFYFSRKDSQQLGTDYSNELKMSPIVAVKNKKTGKTELTLTSVSEQSMAYQRGFKSGDVLISVNGLPVHTKAGAINYFKQHPDLGTYVVEFRRNGRPMTKTFVIPPGE
ncbi:MAG: PDZ domain-containing protein [Planctomycetota bacterium]